MTAQAYDVHAQCDAVPDGGAEVCGGCFGNGICFECGGGNEDEPDDNCAACDGDRECVHCNGRGYVEGPVAA